MKKILWPVFKIILFIVNFSTIAGAQSITTRYFGTTLYIAQTQRNMGSQLLVQSVDEYVEFFGVMPAPYIDTTYLSVNAYFKSGGQKLHIVSLINSTHSSESYALALDNSKGENVDLVIAPNLAYLSDQQKVINIYLQLLNDINNSRNRFLLIDAPALLTKSELLSYREHFDSYRAAIYGPWPIEKSGQIYTLMPSSAMVAGTIMKIDREVGVHKAAAGPRAKVLVNGISQSFSATDQDELNQAGINLIREIKTLGGLYIWGGRSLSNHMLKRYFATSRWLKLIEFSISSSLEFMDIDTSQLDIDREIEEKIKSYLYTLWRDGALIGQKASDSYFAQCSTEFTKLKCIVGVSVLRPREFEVFNFIL